MNRQEMMDNFDVAAPSDLVEKVLFVLEEHGVPAPINDKIVGLIEGWERTLPFGNALSVNSTNKSV